MPVYRISAVRTEYHLIDAYVKARTIDEAEERFDAVLWDEAEPLLWHQDLDSSETEINSIEAMADLISRSPRVKAEDERSVLVVERSG